MILIALKTIVVAGKDPEGLGPYSPILQPSYAQERYREYAGGRDRNIVDPSSWHPPSVSIAPGATLDTVDHGISDAEANDLIANGYARLAPGS